MADSFFFVAFSTLISTVNPMGAVAPFLAMTEKNTEARRRDIAFRAALIMGGVLAFFAAVGSVFFKFFGFTVPALRIAGGVLLFLVAIDMLNARRPGHKGTDEEHQEAAQREDIAVFPLAVPLLSGPGSIASILVLTNQVSSFKHYAALYLSIGLIMAIVFAILRESQRLKVVLGNVGLNLMSRLMGLVLAAVAIQFILDGVRVALPGLAN